MLNALRLRGAGYRLSSRWTRPAHTVSQRLPYSTTSTASATQACALTSLEERGLVSAVTSPEFAKALARAPTVGYVGVDPTAASLHVGHLVPLLALLHLTLAGHHGIALIGGATGSIGDPSGRNTERKVLDQQVLNSNIQGLSLQLKRFFHQGQLYGQKKRSMAHGSEEGSPQGSITIRDNREWFQPMSALHFLGTIGRHARIGPMLARESVRSRMSSSHGLSFTEFSYQLLQAYDFHHLYHHDQCRFQLGGSDQWGNITAGTELISKIASADPTASPQGQEEAYGLTTPLLTTSKGEKFGKSAGNAVWLDPTLTSIFDFYQYFIRVTDEDVQSLLLRLTMLPVPVIHEAMRQHHAQPESRIAQRLLAREMTELVHSEQEADRVEWMSKVLYDPSVASSEADRLIHAFTGDDRLKRLPRSEVLHRPIETIIHSIGAAKSKTAARKLIQSGGVYVNGLKVVLGELIGLDKPIQDRALIIRTGKTNTIILELINES